MNGIKADLHVHSRHSDGSQSVKEIMETAARLKLDMISLTDHDGVSSLPEALGLGDQFNIRVIPGIEISAFDYRKKRKIHLLGYNFNPRAPRIRELCDPLVKARHENTLKMIDIMKKAGYPVSEEEVFREAGMAPALYKQHIMAVLVKKGITPAIYSDLYKELFKGKGICAIDMEYADVFDALEAVNGDGGYAVLAHPGLQDSFDLIPSLAQKGLWGLEVHHESNSPQDQLCLAQLAGEYHLAQTGGSDTHGLYGSDYQLGGILAPEYLAFPLRINPDEPPRMTLARKVMEECALILRNLKPEFMENQLKNNNPADLVTLYDKQIEDHLVDSLGRFYPADNFLTEEVDRNREKEDSRLWIIDPIDGTTNFLHRHKDFAISVAYYEQDQARFGLVYHVMNHEIYEAIAGQGARLNGNPLPVKDRTGALDTCLVDFSLHSMTLLKENYALDLTEMTPLIRGHRAFGTASLILCQIARGETNVYLSAKLCPWDYGAAEIILKEAGGGSWKGPQTDPKKGERKGRVYIAWSHRKVFEELRRFIESRDKKGFFSLAD